MQNFHLGSYMVRNTVGKSVLLLRASGAVKWISDRISDDIPPQMKIFNMVIPILMHVCSFVSSWSVASRITPLVIQRNVA